MLEKEREPPLSNQASEKTFSPERAALVKRALSEAWLSSFQESNNTIALQRRDRILNKLPQSQTPHYMWTAQLFSSDIQRTYPVFLPFHNAFSSRNLNSYSKNGIQKGEYLGVVYRDNLQRICFIGAGKISTDGSGRINPSSIYLAFLPEYDKFTISFISELSRNPLLAISDVLGGVFEVLDESNIEKSRFHLRACMERS